MSMYDRDWYRDHHRQRRLAEEHHESFASGSFARAAFQLLVYCLAVYGALSLVKALLR